MVKKARIGVVIVSYGHEKEMKQIVATLEKQKESGDKIVIVDNHPNKKAATIAKTMKMVDYVVCPTENKGFSAGCNEGVAACYSDVDIFLFLNPDTLPGDTVLRAIREADFKKYAAVMPLLVLPDGKVNSAGNVVHTSGLSWCDGYEQLASLYTQPRDITVLSGACTAISKVWWQKLDGMSESYFMYYEDTDLSTRIILQGGKMQLLPMARVTHDYDYAKGTYKWLYLERNRPLYILRTWPASVIVVLLLELFFVEIGLWLVALLQGRLASKARAFGMMLLALPRTFRERAVVQKERRISGYDFMQTLTPYLDSPVLGLLGKNRVIKALFVTYYRVMRGLLKMVS